MRIISWNVNGIRAAKRKGFLDWLSEEQPDILCIQETKAHPEQLDQDLIEPPGYFSTFHSCSIKKGYSGVATFSKVAPETATVGFGIEEFDQEGRVVCSDFGEFMLFNVYFPNGGQENKRVPYKMRFFEAFFEHCQQLREQGKELIICGDYNIAHKEIDLARPKQNVKTTGFLPEERAQMDEIVNMGYIDTFREFNQDPEMYSWWSYQSAARERNVGWRIDYHFATPGIMEDIVHADIHMATMGSDHCPVSIDLDLEL